MESARAFMEKMKTDEDFRSKVKECKDAEARKAFVLKEGFDFTEKDMELAKAELSDEDLIAIAGGNDQCGNCTKYDIYSG